MQTVTIPFDSIRRKNVQHVDSKTCQVTNYQQSTRKQRLQYRMKWWGTDTRLGCT